MKPSEILRQLADMLDAQQNSAQSDEVAVVHPEDQTDLQQSPDDLFLPPLQMKLELLKKATGVDNVYDEEGAEEGEPHSYDELDAIKRNAGISVVALDALGDDEPLEG
jgi:hypothetical protein